MADRAEKTAKTGHPLKSFRFAHNVYYGKYEVVYGMGQFRGFRGFQLSTLLQASPTTPRQTKRNNNTRGE
jgi:hypothetical protein